MLSPPTAVEPRQSGPSFSRDPARWEAVCGRDAAADGAFFYAVRTTGVYCRPSCAARLPRRENVSFHATAADAERAGFRPCKRCRPQGAEMVGTGSADITAAIIARVAGLDWTRIEEELDAAGCAVAPSLLTPAECAALAASYQGEAPFRSRVIMARHGFGRGEYKYFAYPLPPVVAALRTALYPHLAGVANRWNIKLEIDRRFPGTHEAYLRRMPRRRASPANAAPAAIRRRRLQLPAPGPLRRARVSAAGRHPAVAAR